MKMMTLEEYQSMISRQAISGSGKEGELCFEVKLPSLGRHGYKGVIRCRPLKVKDIKELVMTKIEDEFEYIRRVISVVGKVILDDIDVKELTWNDLLKVIAALRVNSIGNVVELMWTCPKCQTTNTATIDLLELREVEIDPSYPGDPFEIRDKFGNRYLFKFPRVGMFLSVNKSWNDLVDLDLLEWMYVGEGSIDELPIDVALQVFDFVKRFDGYGVQNRVLASCSSCKDWEGEVEIPFFFLLVRGRVI